MLASAAAGALAGALPGSVLAQGASAAPKRVVVIGGALAETAFALGGAETPRYRLVGADTTCTYPDAAKQLPKVGYQRALSAEGLLSLRPDLVLASAEAGPPTAIAQVKNAGVAVTTFDERHDVESVRAKITGVAQALDVRDAGTAAATFRPRLAGRARRGRRPCAGGAAAARAIRAEPYRQQARRRPAHGRRRDDPLRGRAQRDAGLRSLQAADDRSAGRRRARRRADLRRRPRPSAAAALATPGFGATPAGRAQRVVALDALFLLGFGPRLPLAVTTLHRRLSDALA